MKVKSLLTLPFVVLVVGGVLYFAYVGAKAKWQEHEGKGDPPLSAQKGRFQHMDGMPVDLAFDNWTGHICRTWNWDEKSRPELKTYASVPLCASLPRAVAENKGQ